MANHPNRRKAKPAPELWYPTQPIEEFANGLLTEWFNSELALALKDYVEATDEDSSFLGLDIFSDNEVKFWIDTGDFRAERKVPLVDLLVWEIDACSFYGKIVDRPIMLRLRDQLAEVLTILDGRLSS